MRFSIYNNKDYNHMVSFVHKGSSIFVMVVDFSLHLAYHLTHRVQIPAKKEAASC